MVKFGLCTMLSTLLLSLLVGCDQPSETKSAPLRTFFLHGEPETLLSHVNQTRPDSPLPVASSFELDRYSLIGGIRFAKKSPLVSTNPGTGPEAGNEAADGNANEEQVLQNFRLQQRGDKLIFANDFLAFELEKRDGAYHFTKIPIFIWGVQNIEMIHYSIKPDFSVFTLLFRILDNPDNPEIAAFYFAKAPDRSLEKDFQPVLADTRFNYLLGPGIGAPWRQELVFSICEPNPERASKLEEGITAWDNFDDSKDKIGGLPYRIERPVSIQPFSELSQNCLMFVDDYLFEAQDDFAILGLTLPVIDFGRFEYVKSHMFVSAKGITKIDPSGRRIDQVVIHEVGHMLGLDHEFEKDPVTGEYLYDSVMGYGNIDFVTEHDQEAIENLYPEQSALSFQHESTCPMTTGDLAKRADASQSWSLIRPTETPDPNCTVLF